MLQKGFFNVEPFNPNPYWENTVLVNLSGAQKFEENTVFLPGRYRIELAPGKNYDFIDTNKSFVTNISREETITQKFIVRAYCGSNGENGTAGTNSYSGAFKVNGINPGNVTQVPGIDVNHIFGAGGGNGWFGMAWGSHKYYGGGPNCLGNGYYYTDGALNTTAWYGAGSCLHILPVGGTFGTNYIRAYHAAPVSVSPGSAFGGAGTGPGPGTGFADSWFTRGGNSPYGNGATSENSQGTGIGSGGGRVYGTISGITKDWTVGAGAYFNGSNWVDAPGNLTNTGSSYIKITYLGPLQ